MNERVLTLFCTHQNPLIKFNVGTKKYYLPNWELAEEEAKAVKNCLTELYNILKSERVDRRCSRSKGEWLLEMNALKLTKSVGINLSYIGFSYDKCKCLNPMEALFLLETNRMEILLKSIPMSMQECYSQFFNNSGVKLSEYKMYRKLLFDGYKLTTFKDWHEKNYDDNHFAKKLKRDEVSEISEGNQSLKHAQDENIMKIFEKLQENGPKLSSDFIHLDCDYKLYYSGNVTKKDPDLDVHLQSTSNIDPKYGFLNSKALFGIVTPNNVAFYRIGRINIPQNLPILLQD